VIGILNVYMRRLLKNQLFVSCYVLLLHMLIAMHQDTSYVHLELLYTNIKL